MNVYYVNYYYIWTVYLVDKQVGKMASTDNSHFCIERVRVFIYASMCAVHHTATVVAVWI